MKAWLNKNERIAPEDEGVIRWLQGQRTSVAPRPEGRARLKRAALARLPARPQVRPRLGLPMRLAQVGLVLLLLLASAGVTTAAASSLPGEALYSIKVMLEDWRLAMAATPEVESDILAELLEIRLAELAELKVAGNSEAVSAGVARLLANLTAAESLPATPALTQSLTNSQAALTRALGRVPRQTQRAIQAVLARWNDDPGVLLIPGEPALVAVSPIPTALAASATSTPSASPTLGENVTALTPTDTAATDVVASATVTQAATAGGGANPTATSRPGGGSSVTPPGQGGEVPGQGSGPPETPPGQGGEVPGQGNGPPDSPPGQSKNGKESPPETED